MMLIFLRNQDPIWDPLGRCQGGLDFGTWNVVQTAI